MLYKSRKTGKIKEKLSKTGGNDLKICMKCKRAFEDEKKVCDFCGEPLIEIRETDGVKKERIKKKAIRIEKDVFILSCSNRDCNRIGGGTWNWFADNETACNWKK